MVILKATWHLKKHNENSSPNYSLFDSWNATKALIKELALLWSSKVHENAKLSVLMFQLTHAIHTPYFISHQDFTITFMWSYWFVV
jgi:hypothetical protein